MTQKTDAGEVRRIETQRIEAPGPETQQIENLLDALARTRREFSMLHAREAALLTEALDIVRAQEAREGRSTAHDIPLRSMAAQIAAALRMSDRTVQQRIDSSAILVQRFPATLAALADGAIDHAHARVIVDAGLPIADDDARLVYEEAAIEIARRETPGRLRPAVRLLSQRLHPVPLTRRHLVASSQRDIIVRDLDDGMSELIATLPATIAHGILDRLTRLARTTIDARGAEAAPGSGPLDASGAPGSAHASGAPGSAHASSAPAARATPGTSTDTAGAAVGSRRFGEVRADAFADLLLTGHASATVSNASTPESEAIVAHVSVSVPVFTMMTGDGTGPGSFGGHGVETGAAEGSAEPAQLVGRGPIDAATARRLAGAASGWDRVLTHPVSGAVLAVDRYRPSEQLRRSLRVRDEHCRFPGCRQPTHRCDIDHTIAREHDGPTELGNLAHLCRRHHVLKHNSAWRVIRRSDGVLEWTSPTGRVYPDAPARTLTFTSASDLEPPPFTTVPTLEPPPHTTAASLEPPPF